MTTLSQAIRALERIAPLAYAEDWDNVGLLLEPDPADEAPAKKIFLAVDCTEAVVQEALDWKADLLVAYHPPIFEGLKRLTQAIPRQRALLELIEEGVAVYSPHTAADAAPGGVNDWLADAFQCDERLCIRPFSEEDTHIGQGRLLTLAEPLVLTTVVEKIRTHLGGKVHPRVGAAEPHRKGEAVRTIALCPGAGGEVVLETDADVFWTGEMSHHDVLRAVESGRSVVLCEHSNTERGYLWRLADKLEGELPGSECLVSRVDAEPLVAVEE